MEAHQSWAQRAQAVVEHYLHQKDGGFDEQMKAWFAGCDFDAQSVSIGFHTQPWQRNERGGVHGGAIAGMTDTALGIVANFLAGPGEATTTDLNISFLRPLALGETAVMTVFVVKTGRSLIRLRGELSCRETGKLVATAAGSFMPL